MSGPEVVRALIGAFNAGDLAAARELLAEDFSATAHATGQTLDREAFVASHASLDEAFPDLRRELLEVREERPGQVAATLRIAATNDRPVRLPELGIDLPVPTGRRLKTVPHTDHFTVRDGRVVTYRSEQPPGSGLRGLLDQIRKEASDP